MIHVALSYPLGVNLFEVIHNEKILRLVNSSCFITLHVWNYGLSQLFTVLN